MILRVKRLHEKAILPKYQTTGSSGFDFHALVVKERPETYTAIENDEPVIVLDAKSQFIVKTGLAVAIPENHEVQVRPRSGLAAKKSITITNSPGTIDQTFRDELCVIVYNLGNEPFIIHNGDRIAQGVMQQVTQAEIQEIQDFSAEEKEADRGGGFGSTGIK